MSSTSSVIVVSRQYFVAYIPSSNSRLLVATMTCKKTAAAALRHQQQWIGGSKRTSNSLAAQQRQRMQYTTSRRVPQSSASAAFAAQAPAAPSVLLRSASLSPSVELPSLSALKAMFLASAVPMVGFGFMDNLVMIQAGSYIDNTIGVQLGLATMTAAAAGQVVSDVSGVMFGSTLERFLSPWIPCARLSAAQQELPLCRRVKLAGAVCGVIIGCALGASTLWLVDLDSRTRKEKYTQMETIVQDLQRLHSSNQLHVHWEQDARFASDPLLRQCISNREPVVLQRQPDKYCVCVPILGGVDQQQVIGVIEYYTKYLNQEPSAADMDKAKLLSSHLAIIHNRLD